MSSVVLTRAATPSLRLLTPRRSATVVRRDRRRILARRQLVNRSLAAHHGVVTMATLVHLGVPRSSAYRMVERGELTTLLPGVFKGAQWPTGREQLMTAACLHVPRGAIGFTTAAELWGLRGVTKDPLIHVLVPHSCSAALPGFVVHRCRRIDPVDVVRRDDGIRVLSPTRTLLDIADVVRDAAVGSILEQLINDDRGTLVTHAATLARLGHPGRPGTATLGRVLASRPRWRQALQSDLEVKVLAEIARRSMVRPEVQYPVRLPTGEHIRLDFAWPRFREGLEVDHPFWHAGAEESRRDKRRDRKLATIGWHTTRITDLDVHGGLGDAIDDVATILADVTRRA